jgi:hypothetical protein
MLAGSTLADRIKRGQLAQAEHERLTTESQQRQEARQFDEQMRQALLLLKLHDIGARRATPMDRAEAEVGLTPTPQGIRPSGLKARMREFGDLGSFVLPETEEPETREQSFDRRLREAKQLGEAGTEEALRKEKSLRKLKTVEMPADLAEAYGVPADTRVQPSELDNLRNALRGGAERQGQLVTDDTGNVHLVDRVSGEAKVVGRIGKKSGAGEGSNAAERLKLAQQAGQRAERKDQRAVEKERREEIAELDQRERRLHALRARLGEETESGYKENIGLATQELEAVLRRKRELGLVSDSEFLRFIADLRGQKVADPEQMQRARQPKRSDPLNIRGLMSR